MLRLLLRPNCGADGCFFDRTAGAGYEVCQYRATTKVSSVKDNWGGDTMLYEHVAGAAGDHDILGHHVGLPRKFVK